jgi:hypothetical protein
MYLMCDYMLLPKLLQLVLVLFSGSWRHPTETVVNKSLSVLDTAVDGVEML